MSDKLNSQLLSPEQDTSLAETSFEYLYNEDFESADEESLLNLPVGKSIYSDRDSDAIEEVSGLGDFDLLTDLPLLSSVGETFLFRKMNYLKFQAEQLRLKAIGSRGRNREALLRRIAHGIDEAESVRNHIAECNLRLVISIARRFSVSSVEFEDLVSEGNEILLKAITKFDYSRGFRFSTYATHAVQRHFFRYVNRVRRRHSQEMKSSGEMINTIPQGDCDELIEEWIREENRMTRLIAHMAETLDEREQAIIRGRFGLNGAVRTLRELADELGLSKERIRQLQVVAVEKLRDVFYSMEPDMAT